MEKRLHRVFVAIDFPDDVIEEVARVQEILGKVKFVGKLTELENLHLTLKFLGEIDEEKLEFVKERLKEIKFSAFEARLGEAGIFSFRGKPRIVWIKINGKGVFELQKRIDDALEKEGFRLENRFMSHVTIARVKYVKDVMAFGEYMESVKLKDIKWEVDKFKLMESELRGIGPVYREVEVYKV